MKKYYIWMVGLACMLFFDANQAFAGGAIKVGLDFLGSHNASGSMSSASTDVDTGISTAGELFVELDDQFELGGGLGFQVPRALKDHSSDDFYFIPFYAAVRVKAPSSKFTPYGIGQLGYNLFYANASYKARAGDDTDLKGGIYFGIGGGLILTKHFLVELLYSKNFGKGTVSGNSLDVEYSKVTLSLGYSF
ncbi:MAG: outer membrane beta-barrel protein [Desulfobacteraceae bacterium]|nr:outer membrane beta-barrel protein [Desulfobacteraceae bacterium]